jgi:hypothetical protein
MKKHNLVEVTLRVIRDNENDRAILVESEDLKQVWLPRSEIEFEYEDEYEAKITLPEWLAIEKELI